MLPLKRPIQALQVVVNGEPRLARLLLCRATCKGQGCTHRGKEPFKAVPFLCSPDQQNQGSSPPCSHTLLVPLSLCGKPHHCVDASAQFKPVKTCLALQQLCGRHMQQQTSRTAKQLNSALTSSMQSALLFCASFLTLTFIGRSNIFPARPIAEPR